MMLARWRRWGTRRRVEALIRGGVGVSERVWLVGGAEEGSRLAEEIGAWARAEMAGMRRPFGVDHVALALACRDAAGRVRCSASLGVVRPGAFYDGSAEGRLAVALEAALGMAPSGGLEVQVALLRLGDLAFELQGGLQAA